MRSSAAISAVSIRSTAGVLPLVFGLEQAAITASPKASFKNDSSGVRWELEIDGRPSGRIGKAASGEGPANGV